MSCNIATESQRRLPGRLATALALSAFLGLGGLAISANAQPYHHDNRGGYYHGGGRPGGWGGGGYYRAPPVVYAAPYYPAPYYPPPVVYGPAIGIYAPGVSIGIGGQ